MTVFTSSESIRTEVSIQRHGSVVLKCAAFHYFDKRSSELYVHVATSMQLEQKYNVSHSYSHIFAGGGNQVCLYGW